MHGPLGEALALAVVAFGDLRITPADVLQFALVALSIIFHEIAHGYAAYRFGDDTAKRLGRLSMNPLVHIDPLGTLILPAIQLMAPPHNVYLAWAKPVPVVLPYLHPRVPGEIVVALAGIVVNLSIALAFAILLGFPKLLPDGSVLRYAIEGALVTNIALAVFNLLPIPPLDGSRVFKFLLPEGLRASYEGVGQAGMFILFALSLSGVLSPIIVPPVIAIYRFLLRHVTLPILGA